MNHLKVYLAATLMLIGCGDDVSQNQSRTEAEDIEIRVSVRDAASPPLAVYVIDAGPMEESPPDSTSSAETPPNDGVDNAEERPDEPSTCDDLECGEHFRCDEDDELGATCVDLRCASDADCADEQHCDVVCVPDVCDGGATLCHEDGVTLMTCRANGSGTDPLRFCGGEDSGVFSACAQVSEGEAKCTCTQTWDCPDNYACEQGLCEGTGEPATCRLAPEPFDASALRQELVWGGDVQTDVAAERLARSGPWPVYSQSVSIPLVANLDDDNGDGKVNELDFPEIIFMTFSGSKYDGFGVLRAVHAGGPKKGQDMFATCGHDTWSEGQPLPAEPSCEANLRPSTALAIGDLNDPATSDGRPEIVAITDKNRLAIYDNSGRHLHTHPQKQPWGDNDATPSLANLDNQGMAEVIVGDIVFVLELNEAGYIQVRDRFRGTRARGKNVSAMISCVADIQGGTELEVIAGGTVYSLPRPPEGAERQSDCESQGGDVVAVTPEETAFCEGQLLIRWDAARVTSGDDDARPIDGFCAVADVWGEHHDQRPGLDNPLDGRAEVILISEGHLHVLDGETGQSIHSEHIRFAGSGGAPNVDDFDGDGFPEVGSAGGGSYVVMDFQAPTAVCTAWEGGPNGIPQEADSVVREPGGACESDADCVEGSGVCNQGTGQCVCLHNSWRRETEDRSSKATGSTLFDFNGDGATEVIYNDECWFRIYDGLTGETLFKEASESRTRIEYPIVADADNDGNAEIIFATSTESGFCSQRDEVTPQGTPVRDAYNYGIEMWGDAADRWVPSRRIWNQHAYHVTHIREDGTIPTEEIRGWRLVNGRNFNSYRAQPRSAGVAPDLTVPQVGVRSEAGACSALNDHVIIDAVIANEGDVRVGTGIRVAFMGQWGDEEWEPLVDEFGTPIEAVVETTIDARRTARVSVEYRVIDSDGHRPSLPNRVRVMADVGGSLDFGVERECNESNNSADVVVEDPGNLPDLRTDSVDVTPLFCPSIEMTATFTNIGAASAENPTVAFYAGDPEQGGLLLATAVYDGVVEPGEQVMVTTSTAKLSVGHPVRVHAVVDHFEQIEECDESNNEGRTQRRVRCLAR